MKVVSNSSPLVNLSRIGRLEILKSLYGQILIPVAVYQEVVVKGQGMPGALEISKADWIVTRTVNDQQQVRILRFDLDPGESESIVLAMEEKSDLLIMDERIGREMARYLGIVYTGTIGVLMEAKHKGIINRILPVIEELRDKAGFRISESLLHHVLDLADENPKK